MGSQHQTEISLDEEDEVFEIEAHTSPQSPRCASAPHKAEQLLAQSPRFAPTTPHSPRFTRMSSDDAPQARAPCPNMAPLAHPTKQLPAITSNLSVVSLTSDETAA